MSDPLLLSSLPLCFSLQAQGLPEGQAMGLGNKGMGAMLPSLRPILP